jgi:hypothetical protein
MIFVPVRPVGGHLPAKGKEEEERENEESFHLLPA